MSFINIKDSSDHTVDSQFTNNGGAIILSPRGTKPEDRVGTAFTETPGEQDFCGINKAVQESRLT